MTNTTSIRHGHGCFETIRVEHALPMFWEEHYARIAGTSQLLGIDLEDKEQIESDLEGQLTNLNDNQVYILRLIKFKDNPIEIFIEEYEEENTPLKIQVNKNYPIHTLNPLNKHKTCNYLPYILPYEEAISQGYHDALLINEHSDIVELSRANIFLYDGSNWYTPGLESGCLPGIMRERLITQLNAKESIITLDDLDRFEHVIATNSLILTRPIEYIGEWRYGLLPDDQLHALIHSLQA